MSLIFQNVPTLAIGRGQIRLIADLCRGDHPFIITDKGVVAAGLTGPVTDCLYNAGKRPILFDGVTADPPVDVVLSAIAQARASGADCVIGLGGGSSMDVAKLVAVFAQSEQPLADAYGVDRVAGARNLPLVHVPTTAGTGSEVTPIAIVTTGTGEKKGIISRHLMADAAILDAELTTGLPPHVTAASGVDAMVHAIEAFTSKNKKNGISDILAKEALRLLSANIVNATHNGSDIAAREAMLVGAMLAGQSFANASVGGVHALAYPIGGLFHVSHGLSNSLVLPHVLRFNMAAVATSYAELADTVGAPSSRSESGRAESFICHLEALIAQLGLETQLRQVGITENDIDKLTDDALLQERLLVNNPRVFARQDMFEIYTAAF
jgi:alcohol dehydrogenase class IV